MGCQPAAPGILPSGDAEPTGWKPMKLLFVDTAGWTSCADAADPGHRAAADYAGQMARA